MPSKMEIEMEIHITETVIRLPNKLIQCYWFLCSTNESSIEELVPSIWHPRKTPVAAILATVLPAVNGWVRILAILWEGCHVEQINLPSPAQYLVHNCCGQRYACRVLCAEEWLLLPVTWLWWFIPIFPSGFKNKYQLIEAINCNILGSMKSSNKDKCRFAMRCLVFVELKVTEEACYGAKSSEAYVMYFWSWDLRFCERTLQKQRDREDEVGALLSLLCDSGFFLPSLMDAVAPTNHVDIVFLCLRVCFVPFIVCGRLTYLVSA